MRDDDLRASADSNYAESMRLIVEQSCRRGRAMRAGGMLLTSTGTKAGWLDLGFVLAPPVDLVGALRTARAFYAEEGVPWMLRVSAGLFPEAEAAAAGFRYTDDVPGMTLHPMPEPAASYSVEIRPVDDSTGVRALASILSQCFGFDATSGEALITDKLLSAQNIRSYLAYVDGTPVATSMLIAEREIAGIWCIATLNAYRGRGIGEAVTRRAVDEGTRMGCRLANLQASATGKPVYERMGFRVVSQYRTYLPEEIWGGAG